MGPEIIVYPSEGRVIVSNMLQRPSFIARARRGTDLPQADAAAKVGLSRATLCSYESDRVTPSERRTWDLLADLALGDQIPGERPLLLLSFALFGQRFASWRRDLLVFREIHQAQRLADEFDDSLLERVVIVPCWRSHIHKLVERFGCGEVVFEERDVDFETLVGEVFAELSRDAVGWLAANVGLPTDLKEAA